MSYPAPRNLSLPTSNFSDEMHGGRSHERGDRQYPDKYLYEVFGLSEYLQTENKELQRGRRGLITLGLALVILFGAVGLLGRERQVDRDIRGLGSTSVASCATPSGDSYCPRGIGVDDFGVGA